MGVGTAIAVSAVVGLVGSKMSADSIKSGADSSNNASRLATEKNIEFQKWLYGEQTARQQPWVDVGLNALNRLERFSGTNIDNVPKLIKKNNGTPIMDATNQLNKTNLQELNKTNLQEQNSNQLSNLAAEG